MKRFGMNNIKLLELRAEMDAQAAADKDGRRGESSDTQ